MKIDRIVVIVHRLDLRYARCLLTSIRHFHPHVPISLIKDELNGPVESEELEEKLQVGVIDTGVRKFGWGMAKLDALFLKSQERLLILDSDIVFAGPVLDALEQRSEDFVVELCDHDAAEIRENYFDLEALQPLFPDFEYPGFVFNGGQIVATSGLLRRADFEPFIEFSEPRVPRYPELFFAGDQGILNFVMVQKSRERNYTIGRQDFMRWPRAMEPDSIDLKRLENEGYPFLLHWAGPKPPLDRQRLSEVLRFFEGLYYKKYR